MIAVSRNAREQFVVVEQRDHDQLAKQAAARGFQKICTATVTGSTASDRAANSNEFRKKFPRSGAVSGLNMIAARLMPGTISLSRFSHLPPKLGSCV